MIIHFADIEMRRESLRDATDLMTVTTAHPFDVLHQTRVLCIAFRFILFATHIHVAREEYNIVWHIYYITWFS